MHEPVHVAATPRTLIETVVTTGLVTNLGVPSLQSAAAKATARFLEYHSPSVALVAERLAMALAAPGRPAHMLDGLDRLAMHSGAARRLLFPSLLDARINDLLDGRSDFASAERGFGDIQRLRGMLEMSPYSTCLDAAFPAPDIVAATTRP